MSATKKRRVEDEGRTFQEQWTDKYFFGAHAEKAYVWSVRRAYL